MKILLIEDNRNLAKSLDRVLRQEGFAVEYFWNGLEGEHFWTHHASEIDLVLLDFMLPGKNGDEICAQIRREKIHTPTIMLTAKGELEDKVIGFQSGADDYLVKPFAIEELLLRIKSILRRPKEITSDFIDLGSKIYFYEHEKRITCAGVEIALTAKEFAILAYLVHHKNIIRSQEQIFAHCFDFAKDQSSNTIEVHIKNLRQKLFSNHEAKILKTIRGMGYRLEIQ